MDVGGSTPGELEHGGDIDWLEVEMQAGKTYQIDLGGRRQDAGTLHFSFLYGIHDADGNLVADSTEATNGRFWLPHDQMHFAPTEDGKYYVAVGGFQHHKGTYTLSVTEIADDFAASMETTGTLDVGDSVRGEVQYEYDVDWFAVELVAGKMYRVDVEKDTSALRPLFDPYLRGIHDAQGNLIEGTEDNDGAYWRNHRMYSRNSLTEFTATESATYYIAAGANVNGQGTYTVSVTEVVDDFAASIETTGTVEVGRSARGEVQYAGDVDWFAVDLVEGKTYRVDVEETPNAAHLLVDPYLRGIHDAEGNFIEGTKDDDGGDSWNSRTEFTATESATYYVAAGSFGPRRGTYKVSVTESIDDFADDFAASIETTGTVEVGGSVPGEIQYAEDVDWFAIELVAGKTYRVDLEKDTSASRPLRDPYLQGIHDAQGNFIEGTKDDDSGSGNNSRTEFTATESATYYVAAGAYGFEEGSYTLSVEELI